jgi:hypothetical protein
MLPDLVYEHTIPWFHLVELLYSDVVIDLYLLIHHLVLFERLNLPLEPQLLVGSDINFVHQILVDSLIQPKCVLLGNNPSRLLMPNLFLLLREAVFIRVLMHHTWSRHERWSLIQSPFGRHRGETIAFVEIPSLFYIRPFFKEQLIVLDLFVKV